MDRYAKVLQLGDKHLEGILEGDIFVEEKIDGSQFRIQIDENGVMTFGSKSVDYNDTRLPDKMFIPIIEIVSKQLSSLAEKNGYNMFIYGEYLHSPTHNTLKYERVPKNNLAIFDIKIIEGDKVRWFDYDEKKSFAEKYGFEAPSLLYRGDGKELNKDKINSLLTLKSALGNSIIEGIVVKNYNKYFDIVKFPYLATFGSNWLIGKYVRDDFKELNRENWQHIKASPVQTIINELQSNAKRNKVLQHLREKGELEGNMRDMPKIIAELIKDINEEDKETIKDILWKWHEREILGGAQKGLAEFYKQKLLDVVT